MCKLFNSNIALTYKHLDLVHPDEQPNHHGRNDPRDERGVDEGEGELLDQRRVQQGYQNVEEARSHAKSCLEPGATTIIWL